MSTGQTNELKIGGREQLIQALRCATELEHQLCLEYLFAAFSVRRTKDDFPTDAPEQKWRLTLGYTKPWIAQLYMIARQEMEHLGIATNLLSAVGGEPNFERRNFPIPESKSLVGVPMCLDRFGKTSLSRFIWYERPEYLTPTLPKSCFDAAMGEAGPNDEHKRCAGLEIETIQELYDQILLAFQKLPAREIFVGNPNRQLGNVFGYRIQMMAVQSADDAANAINQIIEQGEGIGANPRTSDAHFQRFVTILADLEQVGDEILDPALPVVTNPVTRSNPHGYPVSLITRPQTVQVMKLFNDCYYTMLVMLKSFFATHFEYYTPQPRCDAAMFYAAFFPMMTMVIRPLGEILCRMPAGESFGDQNAGPAFELDDPVMVKTDRIWYFEQLEGLAAQSLAAVDAVDTEGQKRMMRHVYENLTSTRLHLDHIWQHGN